MKYPKDKVIVNLDGKPIVENAAEGPLTLEKLMLSALLAETPPDPLNPIRMTGEEKNRRFLLALKIQQAAEFVELSIEELTVIKRAVAIFPPLYVGRAYAILEMTESS